MDRIDIHIEVPAVSYGELSGNAKPESSKQIRERVIAARKLQIDRFKDTNVFCNAVMRPRDIKKFCLLESGASSILQMAVDNLGLSARAYSRVLKTARTIADLDNQKDILRQRHSRGYTIQK